MPGPELRDLPSVDDVVRSGPLAALAATHPHARLVEAARAVVGERREALLAGGGDGDGDGGDAGDAGEPESAGETPGAGEPQNAGEPLSAEALGLAAARLVERADRPGLRPLVNATGVVVHTNLGRAPLADEAVAAIEATARRYTNLELDLEAGARGSRHTHVEGLLRELTGAEAAIAVNNCAAAVLLALGALARGREVVVSRGQLVEIGGSFRIPEILEQSGARLREVGTTNRTRPRDYRRAIGSETAVLMRVHASNFRAVGFVEEVAIEDICALARERGVAVVDDLGSGALARGGALEEVFADEPDARASVAAGSDVVCFSGDKLLGGPQAGIMVGRAEAIAACRSHPLARAVRMDKLSLAALEATLRLYRDPERVVERVPVLRMLSLPESELQRRAAALRDAVAEGAGEACEAEVVAATGRVGGGALPLLELAGPVCAVRPAGRSCDEVAARLRAQEVPVIARVHEGRVLLDPRTMTDEETGVAAAGLIAALR